MGRAPCCDKANVKKGPWSPEEDSKLKHYIETYGTGGNWISLPQKAGLRRCGKSCRLRWLNYLRPNIKHGEFSADEDRIICTLFATIGSRWSIIAAQLPGRTDNDIKNYWNTKLKKKLMGMVSSSSSSSNATDTNYNTPKIESLSPKSHKNPTFDYQPLSNNNNYEQLSTNYSIPLFNYCNNNPNSSGSCLVTNPFDQNNLYETLKLPNYQMEMGFDELELFGGLNSIGFNNNGMLTDEKMMMVQQNNEGYSGNYGEGNAMMKEEEEMRKKKKKREIMEEKYF